LNNDTNAYSQLVTAGDTICVQQIMTPCTEDVLCDPDMYEAGVDDLMGWDVLDGWSSTDPNHIAYDGASAGAGDVCEQSTGAYLQGVVYRLEYIVTSITGDSGVTAALGLSVGQEASALGTYVDYFICQDASDTLAFLFTNPSPAGADTIEINVVSFQTWVNDCWTDELAFGYPSWSYDFDTSTLQGNFCAVDVENGDLVNSSAFTTTGNYHKVSLTITDVTVGGLEVILGGVYLGTTTGNGQFNFYGVPTSGTDLVLRKVDLFDGCVSQVNVDDFGLIDNTAPGDSICQLTVVNSARTQESSIIDFEVWDDRIIWCFNTTILTGELSPIEMDCNDTYNLKIIYNCTTLDTYYSTTAFRWGTWDCTFVFSAYSDGYAFGFYFGSVTAPLFYLTQRLRILQFAPKYPAIGEEYLYSNGSFSRSFAQSGKVRQAWFDYVDEPTHDVIRLQLLSDVLTLDSDAYFAPLKDYEPEWDEHRYNLAQSRVELVKEETLFNRSCFSIGEAPCTTNVVTIPPSTTVGYEMIGEFDLTNVDASNFDIYELFNGSYGTQSGNDATTLAGRNALTTYFQSFFTGVAIGLNGTITNTSITYVAPMLQITILGTGRYDSTYSAFSFSVDVPTIPSNVIMIQPA
jgi:hypothetical protein